MAAHTFFLHLMLILLTARLLAELAARIAIPPVIGELLAGVVLGPSLLGWVEPDDLIRLLAEVGIILLLFEVGLETDVTRLIASGPRATVVAVMGLVLPFLLGMWFAVVLFGLPLLLALFAGGTLTATSIGITVRTMADLRRQHSMEGQVVLGAAVLDDVLGVMLLALLFEFARAGGVSWENSGRVFLFVAVFFLIAPALAKFMSLVIRHLDETTVMPGLIPTTIVSLVLFFAWLAHLLGVPELLGGFAAGLALSRRFFLPFGIALTGDHAFAARIGEQMGPIVRLFSPIFFVMVGLSLHLHEIDWRSSFIWEFSGAMLVAAVVGKLAGALVLPDSWRCRWIIGAAMIPRGEVGLVFAELGRSSGIFSNAVYAALIIVIALTTLVAPLVLKALYRLQGENDAASCSK